MSIKCARMATLLGPCLISLIIVGFSFFVSSSLNSTLAQTTSIVADDTLPGSNNSLLTEIGNRIDISGGHNVGSNLFHSFSEFQVGSGDTASFQSQGAANILSRVTGSDPSNIFGTIGIDIGTSTQSQANLFFMNPNGIVFGPSARLDLKGSFHVTTADFLRLQAKEEGGRFSADPNGPNKLIEADPNGFGFLSGNPTGITVNGSLSNGKSLEVLSGKTLSIIGGPVTVDNALLQAPSGQINVVSAASGEEAVVVGNINEKSDIVLAPQPGQGGKINFNSTVLETSSSGTSASGRVVIRGGELVMKGASPSLSRSNAGIYSVNSVTADTSGRTIDIKISGSYQLTDGGVLDSGSKGAGKAGDIFIGNFGELTLTKGAQIDSSNFGSGDGGRITLKGKQITITDQASVTSTTTGAGSAGVITLTDFEQFALSNGAKIVGSSSGSGESGIININEGRTVEIADGARIANEANGTGNSRSIGINVTDLVKVSNADISTQAAPGSTGQGGDIDIQANQIKILDGTRLSSQAEGEGAAGSIRLLGTSIGSSVTVSGEKVVANMFTPSLLSASSGATVAEANYDTALADATTPRPGQIIIQGDRILLQDKATVTSSTSGAASGGDITLRGVEQLTLANEVSISSTSSGSGNSGAIIVDGKSVTIVDGARLDIQTLGAGDARFILMTATDLVRVASADISAQATPNSTGRAGAIDIQANQIQIVDGTRLSGQAMGEGAAGSIRLLGTGIGSSVAVSGEKVVGNESTPSLLTATSGSAATRANYDVAFAAAFKEEPGKEPERIGPLPGEIILEADQILLQDSATITSATDGAAPGGNVTLQKFEQLTVTNGSTITSTSSGTGESGAIVVNGKTVTIADGARLEIEVEGTGDSRFIGITATETVRVANADISTKATPNSKGRAGSIDIEANRIQIVEGSQLSSQALGEGAAGGIRLRATDTTEVSGGQVRDGQFRVSSVEASSGSAVTPENYNAAFADAFKEEPGKEPERIGPLPGEIILEANQIILQDGATISSATDGEVQAGGISLNAATLDARNATFTTSSTFNNNLLGEDAGKAGNIFLKTADSITLVGTVVKTEAENASGGNIDLIATDHIQIASSTITSRVREGADSAGRISIDPDYIAIHDSLIDSSASRGNGGPVSLSANLGIFIDTFSIEKLDTSSQFGNSGLIDIQAPILNLSQAIAPLPEDLVKIATLYNAHCAGQENGKFSSFSLKGLDRIPHVPGELIPTPLSDLTPARIQNPQIMSSPIAQRLQLPEFGLDSTMALTQPVFRFDEGCPS